MTVLSTMCMSQLYPFLTETTLIPYRMLDTPLQSTSVHSLRKYVSLEPSSYSNILLISNHFLTHVKDVGSSNTLVPKDIISLIQEHFETLELRPVKGLDYVQPYHENPGETQFFRLFQRQVSAEWKDNVRSRVLNL